MHDVAHHQMKNAYAMKRKAQEGTKPLAVKTYKTYGVEHRLDVLQEMNDQIVKQQAEF
jgi:hypothetical protein